MNDRKERDRDTCKLNFIFRVYNSFAKWNVFLN